MQIKKGTTIIQSFSLIVLLSIAFSCANQNQSNTKQNSTDTKDFGKLNINRTDKTAKLKFSSMIRSLLEDSKGNFWIGSDAEGVCKYDGKSFRYFTMQEGLSDNQIRSIQEDVNGIIWFRTGDGITSYEKEKFEIHKKKFVPKQKPVSKWSKEQEDLWIGDGDQRGGIYKWNGDSLVFLTFPFLNPDHNSFSIEGPVTGICYGKNNVVWIASYGGVIGYDGKTFSFISERGLRYHVRAILEDSHGNLWIGNNGIGALLYDGNSTINISDLNSHNKAGINSLFSSPKHIFSIEEDSSGNIWFADRDTGAWKYDGKTFTNYTKKDGLTNVFVRVIYRDSKGELWFGMADGNLLKFNGSTFNKMY